MPLSSPLAATSQDSHTALEHKKYRHANTSGSMGERLLPYLLASIDACIVLVVLKGMVNAPPFREVDQVVPAWWLFLMACGLLWLAQTMQRLVGFWLARHSQSEGVTLKRLRQLTTRWYLGSLLVLLLVVIWVQWYTQQAFLLDPRWLAFAFDDITNNPLYIVQALFIAMLIGFFGVRGLTLSRKEIEAQDIVQVFKSGIGFLLGVLLVRTIGGVNTTDSALLLVIPGFLFLGLLAHTLAKAAEKRNEHYHAQGLLGSVRAQEGKLLLNILLFSLVLLLVTLLITLILSPNWLAQLTDPFFHWLKSLPTNQVPPHGIIGDKHKVAKQPGPGQADPEWNILLRLAAGILAVVLVLILSTRWMIARAARRRHTQQIIVEIYTSAWSWELFKEQLKAFFKSLWQGIFRGLSTLHTRMRKQQDIAWSEELTGEPATRTVREIYRAFLRHAFKAGYARHIDETPAEFRQRLLESMPAGEGELTRLTNVYTMTRYSGTQPSEGEIAAMRQSWQELRPKVR
ncbi:hypothetical protein KSD_62260 [Ktedonobacter sp. SOSP1-85]|uniref:DUF4129 domain-containing protein n=1 Tax=Ktedonobacter sp. SOSP1-85 TaxID=2778367 RepID=UPI0019168CCA|nr:DUF4129 domain-containing protein [Ktedonobacter sp. SOSP1-85]GHO78455.1 hypothetical protein KSD_62260 [Ktedonobacter sp. SOSP1-85]